MSSMLRSLRRRQKATELERKLQEQRCPRCKKITRFIDRQERPDGVRVTRRICDPCHKLFEVADG